MIPDKSEEVEKTLRQSTVHEQWINAFRTQQNISFFEQALGYALGVLNPGKDSQFLDAGCGTCTKSILLAKSGYNPVAVDFSQTILKMAEANIQSAGMGERIVLKRENILSFTFENETFDHIVCWGVLMHIPDLEKAISELCRVLKNGGAMIIAENNMFSLQSLVHRFFMRFPGKRNRYMKREKAGLESWIETPDGMLLIRQTDMRWFKKKFITNGFRVERHVAGQFTELYSKFSSHFLKGIIHGFNRIWFKYVKLPGMAFGNILILRKKA